MRGRTVILVLISLILVGILAYYLYVNAAAYLSLIHVSFVAVVCTIGLTTAGMLLNGWITLRLLHGLGTTLSFRDSFVLTSAATLANQLPVSGGILTRGVYLKNRHDLGYTKFFSATLALFFCFVAANGIIGLVILLYWIVADGRTIASPLIIGFSLMLAALLVLLLPVQRLRLPFALHRLLSEALDGWNLIGRNLSLLAELVAAQTGLVLLTALRYWLAFHMLSQPVTVGHAVLFAAAAVLTQIATFAPGGLGVTEAIVGGVAALLGLPLSASVAAVVLDRLISSAVILLVGGISAVILGHHLLGTPPRTSADSNGGAA